MEQLGPFHIFFTLSCGEARWAEMYISVLQVKGRKVKYTTKDWDGSADTVLVCLTPEEIEANEEISTEDATIEDIYIPLSEYKEKYIKSVTNFFKDHYVLLTRIFDDRVKNFLKNILMLQGVAYYAYRIEFQMRGMAHVHGVLWLKNEKTKGLLNENKQFMFNNEDVEPDMIEFIDSWTTCALPEDDKDLYDKVKSVNSHACLGPCKKKGTCLFNFPRLPSKRTLIAKPNPFNLEEEELKVELETAKLVLTNVKQALIDLEKNNLQPDPEETLDSFIMKAAGVEYEVYERCLQYSERGNVIVLKRTVQEKRVNNYNPLFLKAWDANIDVQASLSFEYYDFEATSKLPNHYISRYFSLI